MRQILVTVGDHVREIDIADIVKNMMWHFENQITKAEYLDGPKQAKPSRSDIDKPIENIVEHWRDNPIDFDEPIDAANPEMRFDPATLAAAQQAAAKAEGVSVDDVPVSKPRKGKRK
jgi:hypothetical protein